ncbi:hypothetical protein ACH4TQ_49105 [Streptomyces sp. NPDC021218]|uniref:hypothetical protein n=1 Tax=Streptomyces TaxID=1883 RepID=UPI00363B883A
MGIEREYTWKMNRTTLPRAIGVLQGWVPLHICGTAAESQPRIKRKARLYAYLHDYEKASDRWVLDLVSGNVRRVRKERISADSKIECVTRESMEPLRAAGEFVSVLVKLKCARVFRSTVTGARVTASLDLLVPITLDWELAGTETFWHLELEGHKELPGKGGFSLGGCALPDQERITESKAQEVIARLGVDRPYRLGERWVDGIVGRISRQLWSMDWVPEELGYQLSLAGLDARRHFARVKGRRGDRRA